MERIIRNHLSMLGVPAHIKGYNYVKEAIICVLQDPDTLDLGVTKKLYPEVAKRFKTTASRVERAIRHAIEVAWDRGDVDTLDEYFGNTISANRGKPTNSEFIANLSEIIRLNIDKDESDKKIIVTPDPRPRCKLVGESNIFKLIETASSVLKESGLNEDADKMAKEAMAARSYTDALAVINKYVEAY